MYKPPLNFTVSDIDIFSMAALFDYLVFIEKIVEGYRLAIRNTPTPCGYVWVKGSVLREICDIGVCLYKRP